MNNLQMIQQVTNVLTNSSDAYELCRNLVHCNFANGNPTGATLLAIDQRGQLRNVASYGMPLAMPGELSLWDNHPVSIALQSRSISVIEWDGSSIVLMPFIKNAAPTGGLVIKVKSGISPTLGCTETSEILGQLGAFYLDMNGLQVRQPSGALQEDSTQLTERQLTVLSMMSLGQTNAEIARAMLLSESTIRQESVKIYRSLGVNSRVEATRKARALGLISARPLSALPTDA